MTRLTASVLMALVAVLPARAQTIRTLPLRATALAAEPVSGRLFAATPPNAGPGANSVVPIAPATGVAGAAVFVGSDPQVLAPTDDGQFLYVGFAGVSAVRRVDLGSLTAGPLFPLTRVGSSADPEFARAIVPVPGAPSTIVVLQGATVGLGNGLVAYDNGVPRPGVIRETVSSVVALDASTFLATTASAMLRLRLDAGGLTLTGYRSVSGGAPRFLAADGGLAYGEYGSVYDAATFDLVRQPWYPSNSYYQQRLVVPSQGRTYITSEGALITRDLATGDLRASVPLPTAAGMPASLVALGGGVAYHTDLPQVVMVGDFTTPAPVPAVQAFTVTVGLGGCSACRVGQPFQAAATFTNAGAAAVPAEVKSRIVSPTGAVYPTGLGGPHAVVAVAPGAHSMVLLSGTIPPGVPFGNWRIEITLLDPVSGRIFATATRLFTIDF